MTSPLTASVSTAGSTADAASRANLSPGSGTAGAAAPPPPHPPPPLTTSYGHADLAFCRRLPKIELHAHLSGSISRECLHQVWQKRREEDPSLDLLDPLLAIPPGKTDYDLQTFFPLFSTYIYKLCSDVPSLVYTTDQVLASFEADGVAYLELRTTPRAIPEHNISKADYVDLVLSRIAAHNNSVTRPNGGGNGGAMQTKLILSVDRRNTPDEADEVVELAISRMRQGVVGVDLCGNPARELTAAFGGVFEKAKRAGLKLTLHFAEAPSSSSLAELQTLLSWRPDRLGHVIHIDANGPAVRDEIVRRRIGVELCLSCNVKGKLISGEFADHHFGWWKDSGVGVALGTDDVGVFLSPLSEEYYLAAQHFHLSKADIRRLCEGAVEVIFGTEQEKETLRRMYADWPGWA